MQDRFKLVVAVHLFLIKHGKVLLLRRFNTGYEDGNYSVPAGHIDGGESITTAMQREALEEIGLTIAKEDLEVIHVMHRNPLTDTGSTQERIEFFFSAKKFQGKPTIMESDKCDELQWADLDHLPTNVVPYIKAALEAVNHELIFSEFGW